ncbi:uncharacterized protein YlxW (UPF0749 family) [Allocatelliglobosispora scoriae]|uniref:Uncharacterized protein YlxW (UPF0749 family) n=1 Tax=Allocatelliglobosispora scoriae TaxID=643052 RepID=A0A841BY13_9ACTN|nr:DUF881 domain-containing protein [Allocatelliglobosispora scoriae]MBB5874047.1 uncharacterized protein YlxW (UPF0749 family) [Allocatelliglobosispora scoriae]
MTTPTPPPTEPRYQADFLTELFRDPLDPGYADAAAATKARGYRRRPLWLRIVAGATMLSIGFLLAVAYQHTQAEQPGRAKVREGLIDQINARRTSVQTLADREEKLGDEVTRLRDAAIPGPEAARLRTAEAAAGYRKVTGDGIVVTIGDGPEKVDPVTGKVDLTTHVLDLDLRLIVNQLWANGAEAISINGNRLTSTSTIRLAGEAIQVDFQPMIGPYEVSAIGPGDLADDFDESRTADSYRGLVKEKGLTFSISERDDLVLPSAPDPVLRYATPLVSKSPSPSPSTSPSGGRK